MVIIGTGLHIGVMMTEVMTWFGHLLSPSPSVPSPFLFLTFLGKVAARRLCRETEEKRREEKKKKEERREKKREEERRREKKRD